LQVKQKGIDPYEVEVEKALEIVRRYLPEWKIPEDLILDAETLNQISRIIDLQSEWLRNRASSMYVDPLMIELKVRALNPKTLSDIFIESWHPPLEMERLTQERLKESIEYWKELPPLEERLKGLPAPPSAELELTSMDALLRSGLLSEKTFDEVLQMFWQELKDRSKVGKETYWSFILADTYEETILRAYITSFLVSYGYATLEMDPLKEDVFLIPFEEERRPVEKKWSFSMPISIDYETWKKMKEGKRIE